MLMLVRTATIISDGKFTPRDALLPGDVDVHVIELN